jgi:DNA gyrase subunit A
MSLEAKDSLVAVFTTAGEGEVILVSAQGQGIRFAEEEVRPMGLPAAGVWGMKLAKGDEVAGGGPLKPRADLLIVTENGMGKRVKVDEFSRRGRHGQGVIALAADKETGPVAAASVVNLGDRVMMISARKNSKTVYARAFAKLSRTHKGKPVMSINGRDKLARLVILLG